MDEQKYLIPQYLDEPERILFWTRGEVLFFFLFLFLGIHFQHFLLSFLTGVALLFLIKKMQAVYGDDLLQSTMYWYLPTKLLKRKGVSPSCLRRLIG